MIWPRIYTDETQIKMLEIEESGEGKLLHEETTRRIIGAAFEVHDQLGYDFWSESINVRCK